MARLYQDAGALAFASIANAVLGVAFWMIAARIFSPHDLGIMTAVLAVITSTGVVISTGIGDSYAALLPAVGSDRHHFYRRGQRLFVVLAILAGAAAALGTVNSLDAARGSIAVAALVFVGVLVWASTSLQNTTLVAVGRARWLPLLNVSVSLGKLALLPLFALLLSWHPLELAVVTSAAVAVLIVAPRVKRIVVSGEGLPLSVIPGGLSSRSFYGFVGQTMASSALGLGLFLVTPFLVTVWSTPAEGALFALSLSIVQSLDLLGAAMTMSLVVHASSNPENASAMARAILIRTILLSVIGAAVITAVAPVVLRMLNPTYGEMGAMGVIAALAVGTVCRLLYQVWQGLQRSRRKMLAPLVLNVVAALSVMVVMPHLCRQNGALGGAQSLLLAQLLMTGGIVIHYITSRNRIGAVRSA